MHSPGRNRQFEQLHDTVVHDERSYSAGVVSAKFCSFGFVTSKKWFAGYLTVLDGVVRLYENSQACQLNPQDFIQQIQLTLHHQCSAIKMKDYSTDPRRQIPFYCFYIEKEAGVSFLPQREIKIGCTDPQDAEKFVHAVNLSCGKAA